jgi:hypothetical protein
VREERVLLEDVAAAALLGRHVDPFGGVEPGLLARLDPATLWPQKPGSHSQHARLAGAGRAREREALTRTDLERDVEGERPEPRLGLNP